MALIIGIVLATIATAQPLNEAMTIFLPQLLLVY